jgi:hypothetical protein
MCCCGKPVINGQPGYKWQPNDAPSVYPLNPPTLTGSDQMIYDEPGRCGGLDSHSHHFRVVQRFGQVLLMVRHGGGQEQFPIADHKTVMKVLADLETHARYWLLHALYSAHSNGARMAEEKTTERWRQAAAEKRIKTRKVRGTNGVRVWIEDPAPAPAQ